MAITPFTQPVQQSEFIPGRRRLPTQAIAQATGQYVQRDTRNRDQIDVIQSQLESQLGQREALSPAMERYRERIQEIAEDDLYANDTRAIQQLAREAERDIGLVEQHQANIQEEMENAQAIEDDRRRRIQQTIAQQSQLGVTDDGRIDQSTVHSPRTFGEETDPYTKIEEVASSLESELSRDEEQNFIEAQRQYPNMNKIQLLRQAGVSQQRIKKAASEAFRTDPGIQNRLNNRTREILATRDDIQTMEEARSAALGELSGTLNEVSDALSYTEYNTLSGTIPDRSNEGVTGYGSDTAISFNASPVDNIEYPQGSEERRTSESFNRAQVNNLRREILDTDVANRISEIEQEAQEQAEQYRQRNQNQPSWNQSNDPMEDVRNTEEAIKNRLLREEGIYQDYVKAQEEIQPLVERGAADMPTTMYTSSLEGQTNLGKTLDILPLLEEESLSSVDAEIISDETDGWFSSRTNSDEILRQAFGHIDTSGSLGMNETGDFMTFRVRDTESVEPELRGQTLRVNMQNAGKDFRMKVAEAIGGPQGEAIKQNIRHEGARLQYDLPEGEYETQDHIGQPNIGLRGEVRGQNRQWVEASVDGEPVTIGSLAPRGGSPQEQRARTREIARSIEEKFPGHPLGDYNALYGTLEGNIDTIPDDTIEEVREDISVGGGEPTDQQVIQHLRQQFQERLNTPMSFPSKGAAMEYSININN